MTADSVQLQEHPLWSATPTPLTDEMEIDFEATRKLVEHHVRLGVSGLFVLGTCGEGPWLPVNAQRDFVQAVSDCSAGRLVIGAQVTDNSALRIIDNMERVAEDGADVAIMAAPWKVFRPNVSNLTRLYLEAIEASPIPVGIYDLGERDQTVVPGEVIAEALQHEKVIVLKDSSGDEKRRDTALAIREQRPKLRVMSGDEFDTVSYLAAGYDGLVLGGGIFNGYLARQIMSAVQAGEVERARSLQQTMNALMYDVYGGEEITCWLRGLKHLLVRMGIFNTENLLLDYDLTEECRERIESALDQYSEILFPDNA